MIVETSFPSGANDGFLSLEGGQDSGRDPALLLPTVAADALNVQFRGGMPTNRPGVNKLDLTFADSAVTTAFQTGLFQGAGSFVTFSGKSFIVLSISGTLYSVPLSNLQAVALAFPSGDSGNSPTLRKSWFEQADRFLIVQNAQSKPLIWDGAVLRRATRVEVPTGGPMAYGLGRLWVATGRSFVGGDIIYGDPAYGSANVLRFTENTVISEGGSFSVPWQAGDITGMSFAAKTDTSAGDGSLMVGVRNGLFEFEAPSNREIWRDLQQPIQRFALLRDGPQSHESMVQVNDDLFFRAGDGYRSFRFTRKEWNTWANTPISREIQPTMDSDEKRLLYWCSTINFNNRFIGTASPVITSRGTVHRVCVALDFDLVSSISQKLPPAWDGKWLLTDRIFQLLTVQNNDNIRAFAIGLDEDDVISIWEISRNDWTDDGEDIQWQLTTRSFQFNTPLELKNLKNAELWMNEMSGDVQVDMYYRPDGRKCWSPWSRYSENFPSCNATPSTLTCTPSLFPMPGNRTRISFGEAPNDVNAACGGNAQNSNVGYEFQVKMSLTGHTRLRRLRVSADRQMESEYGPIQSTCTPLSLSPCQTCSENG